jgi:1,4-dihydroxy-2-naphthoyl-CoA hydrolase
MLLGWRVELLAVLQNESRAKRRSRPSPLRMDSSDHDAGAELDATPSAARASALAGGGWIEVLGLEFVRVAREAVVAQWDIGPRHLQPHGIVHGGVYASVVETCCSVGAALLAPPGKVIVGVENHTSFIRPLRDGQRLTARAAPLHAGRRAQLWECNICDAEARLIATGRLRVMCVDPEREK